MDGPKPTYEFGNFGLDAGKRLLLRDGEPVALTPKALETLLVLLEHRDRVLTKDELLQRIWGDTIVEEGGLARNISVLRKALGESPDEHHYIVTIPGRGYRFVAGVRETGPAPVAARSSRWNTRRALGAAAIGIIGLAGAYASGSFATSNASRAPITALAVLPLENLSGDSSQEYFADGMTEALIAGLGHIRALRVVSRTSVMRFKGTAQPVQEIGRTLNVDAVIEGSVQQTADRVRITVQLIDASSDRHLWTRAYERPLTDVLALQAEVARAVAEEVNVQISAEERARLASAERVHPAAYQEYLLGQHYLWRLTEEDLARAIDHFERSARLDPAFAATYAGLSHAWWWRGIWGATLRHEVESPARAAANKALELDPALPEAHVSVGRMKFGYDRDWSGADRDFKKALQIDPNNADAHFFSAMLCMALGCFAEAIAHMERLEDLDPLSATVQSFFGRVLYRARTFDEAIVHFKRAIDLAPYSAAGAYHRLSEVYEELGRYSEALALLEKAAAIEKRQPTALTTARIYARMGKRTEAKAILAASKGSDPYALSTVYAALGEHDDAFRLLLAALRQSPALGYANTDPKFDRLRGDPRWQEVLRQLNLPPSDGDTVRPALGTGQPAPLNGAP